MNYEKGIIAVDNGGNSTNVFTKQSFTQFPSVKGEYRKRNLESTHGKHDYIVELNGKRYMAGTLAKNECQFPIQMHSDTKQNLFYDLSILIAIHQFGFQENYLMTCVPIYMHNEHEKSGIHKRLVGDWTITVNGEEKSFSINDVKVAPETVSAFWSEQPKGVVRWVDWGSRTIGYGTTINDGSKMAFIDFESGTFRQKGLDTVNEDNYDSLVDFVAGKLYSVWNAQDIIYHIGGGAMNQSITKKFKEYFPNSKVVKTPIMANAKGLYELGRKIYDKA